MGLLRGGTEQRGLRGLRGTAGREVRASLMCIRQSDCLRVNIEAVAGNEMQALATAGWPGWLEWGAGGAELRRLVGFGARGG